MERFTGKIALVTGASVGIGAAVSSALVKHGLKVVGCGRNLSRLQEFAASLEKEGFSGSFHPVECDVSKEEQVLAMFDTIQKEHGGVDICVNNAGLGHDAPLLRGSTDQWIEMLNVNVLGLSICTREAVKSMRQRKIDDGHIFNMCSMSGHRILPNSNTHFYGATKCAVNALTEGTRNELRELKSHIRITQISPAVVETEFFARKSGEASAAKLYKTCKFLEAKDVADALIYALSAPPHVQVHDIMLRATEQKS